MKCQKFHQNLKHHEAVIPRADVKFEVRKTTKLSQNVATARQSCAHKKLLSWHGRVNCKRNHQVAPPPSPPNFVCVFLLAVSNYCNHNRKREKLAHTITLPIIGSAVHEGWFPKGRINLMIFVNDAVNFNGTSVTRKLIETCSLLLKLHPMSWVTLAIWLPLRDKLQQMIYDIPSALQ